MYIYMYTYTCLYIHNMLSSTCLCAPTHILHADIHVGICMLLKYIYIYIYTYIYIYISIYKYNILPAKNILHVDMHIYIYT